MRTMVKVLVCGSVQGKFQDLANRLETLNSSKHGPFDCVLCVGEFFGKQEDSEFTDYIADRKKTFAIPVYFIVGNRGHECLEKKGNEISKNLTFLGAGGIKRIEELGGLNVAFISGCFQSKANAKRLNHQYGEEELKLFEDGSSTKTTDDVDLFLSNEWPLGIFGGLEDSMKPVTGVTSTFSEDVKSISLQIIPRYHFAGIEPFFYQRAPFENGVDPNDQSKVTRFISMGNVDPSNKDKGKKWLHALALTPLSVDSSGNAKAKISGKVYPNPFFLSDIVASLSNPPSVSASSSSSSSSSSSFAVNGLSRERMQAIEAEESAKNQQHFFATRSFPNNNGLGPKRKRQNHKGGGLKQKKRKRKRFNVAPRGDCWYCLASPSCETHLIVSVSDDSFISLPKGGISAQHCQIVPVSHEPYLGYLEHTVLKQVILYKESLIKFYATFDCVPLFYERNIKFEKALQRHCFLEAIPIPKRLLDVAEATITSQSKKFGFEFEILLEEEVPPSTSDDLPQEMLSDGLVQLREYLDSLLLEEGSEDSDAGKDNDNDNDNANDNANADDNDDTNKEARARQKPDEIEYFYIEIPDCVKPRLHVIPNTLDETARKKLPLNLGRQIACTMMQLMNRVDWKACIVPQNMEQRMADDFKKEFKEFDPI